jgi:hypothetical protein
MTERGQRRVGNYPEARRQQIVDGPRNQHQRRRETVVSLRQEGVGKDRDSNQIRASVKVASLVRADSQKDVRVFMWVVAALALFPIGAEA